MPSVTPGLFFKSSLPWKIWDRGELACFKCTLLKSLSMFNVSINVRVDRRQGTVSVLYCGGAGFKCPTSFTAFLIWAWTSESGMHSPPLWEDGSGSSAVAVGCSLTRSGFSSSGRFPWHNLEPLSAWSHPRPEEPAGPSWSGGRVRPSWRPLRGANSESCHVS